MNMPLAKRLVLLMTVCVLSTGPLTLAFAADGVPMDANNDGKVEKVTFSSDSLRVGFVYKNTGTLNVATHTEAPPGTTVWTLDTESDIGKQSATATVVPAAQAANVSIEVEQGSADRVNLTIVERNTTTGVIKFDVRGKEKTPETAPKGDTVLVARKGNSQPYAKMRVVVIVPAKITGVTPLQGTIDRTKEVRDSDKSIPVYAAHRCKFAPDIVKLYSAFTLMQSVSVVDQFNKPLDALYAHAEITENDGDVMYQELGGGAYPDPFGFQIQKATVLRTSPSVAEFLTGTTDYGFRFQPQDIGVEDSFPAASIAVEVGGHALGNLTRSGKYKPTAVTQLEYSNITFSNTQ